MTIGIIAEKSLERVDGNWRNKFETALADAASIYTRDFKIKFAITKVVIERDDIDWSSGYHKEDPDIDSSDIILFLHSRKTYWYYGSSHVALAMEKNAMIWFFLGNEGYGFFTEPLVLTYLISHEIGHLFGTDDQVAIPSLTNSALCDAPSCMYFDETGRQMILQNKYRQFKR